MPKKTITNEEQIVDLLQKQTIIMLYKEGLTRDEIKETLSVSSDKVSDVIKYFNKSKRNKK
jgi:DNA-directed RNA polymerase specialized sigma subunit